MSLFLTLELYGRWAKTIHHRVQNDKRLVYEANNTSQCWHIKKNKSLLTPREVYSSISLDITANMNT